MHILFATTDFVENNGPTTGLPKYLYRTSKALIEMGHEVTVVTRSNRTVEYDFFGIHVYRVRLFNVKESGDRYEDELLYRKLDGYVIHETIKKIIEKKPVDIIQYASLSGIAYYHDINIPAVMRMSSYAKMWPAPGMEIEMEARAFMEREASKRCDGVFGPSRIVADEFGKDIGRKVEVIETPFVQETKNEDETLYSELLGGRKYILFYGTLIGYKGMQLIADSTYKILSQNKDLYIAIIGDGDLNWLNLITENAKEYRDRVIYHSAIGFSQLLPIIKRAELVMLPSQMENFSNACVECMALGQIVLATNKTSFEQLITSGENGYLCEKDNVNDFVEKINTVLNLSREERETVGRKAAERTEILKPEKVTVQLLDYYKQIIREHREA